MISVYISKIIAGETHRRPAVELEDEDRTNDKNERVDTSFVTGVMARKSSNNPDGGVGPS
jgi:hypothetical protein